MERLDGNAIGGLLHDLFGREMTVATGVCGSCGATSHVAETHVYMRAPGVVVRCPHCGNVLMRVVQSARETWLDLRGLATLRIGET